MNETTKFMISFLKSPAKTGVISPACKSYANKLIQDIDFSKVKYIVELGAGTGSVTKRILKNMRADATLISFEINPLFLENLHDINDKRLKVIADGAENLSSHLKKLKINKVDAIISILPFNGPFLQIKKEIKERVLKAIQLYLSKEGFFIQPAHLPTNYIKFKKIFSKVETNMHYFMFPPTLIYKCKL